MVKTKHVQKIVLIFLFTAMAIAQDARPTVAILDFEGQDISLQEVQTLTERMRSEIGATNAVRLIERKAIENIMAEQGLPQPSNVRLTIVNILGQEVTELVNDWRDMGFHQVRWAGVNDQGLPVSTGVYFSILTDGQQVQIRKMLLVK